MFFLFGLVIGWIGMFIVLGVVQVQYPDLWARYINAIDKWLKSKGL